MRWGGMRRILCRWLLRWGEGARGGGRMAMVFMLQSVAPERGAGSSDLNSIHHINDQV